ncbi:MAG: hypothetical protein QF595_06250 [Dehalococcoidia bacterium]|nr:hypothetical protein [Dehalococcoidia bacterium]
MTWTYAWTAPRVVCTGSLRRSPWRRGAEEFEPHQGGVLQGRPGGSDRAPRSG